jgi:seryl-tRNA synthetase
MLDIRLIREKPDFVRERLAARGDGDEARIDDALRIDVERRKSETELQQLQSERNRLSKEIGARRSRKEPSEELEAEVRKIGEQIAGLTQRANVLDEEQRNLLLNIPNLPHASVPVGKDPSANRVARSWGEKPQLINAADHVALGTRLNLFNLEWAAKLSGSGFICFTGAGAKLERAMINFMLDLHTREHGYVEVLPPFLVNSAALTGTGNLPKFEADLFKIAGEWDLYLVPTAEVPLTNLHRGEILDGRDLPIRYTAYTPCFRSEAGSYGQDVRGLIRQHQFDKVELVKLTTPEQSYDELERLTANAEEVLRRLGLPFRTVLLCTGDTGFASAKTYDIEVWLPSQNTYREISSCSNTEAFQARRANIKFRAGGSGKAELVHTLNGSGLAVGRTLIAILENGQQKDGSVAIPAALQPYMDGRERIEPAERKT